jgi:penicillin amidase
LSGVDSKILTSQEKEAVAILQNWKGSSNLDDVAPTIYSKWIYFYLKNTFQDEMGEVSFRQFLKTHIMKQTIAFQSVNQNSVWWDNIATKNKKETRQEIVTQSLKEAVSCLNSQLGNDLNSWAWRKVHKIEFKHPLGSVTMLRPFFNVGKFEIAGTNEVINNTMFEYSDKAEYTINGGPSTRRIIDFSDVENSWSILPTGQSGNPMSKHYDDQAKMYVAGKFRKMKLNKEEIIKTSTKLVFIPKN